MLGDLHKIYRVYRELSGDDPLAIRETAPGVWTRPEGGRTETGDFIESVERVATAFKTVRNVIGKVNAIPEAKKDGQICPKL